MAVKEKDRAVERLQTYQTVYEELKISDPAKFSREFNEMQDELVKLNKNLAEKGKQIKSQESKFKVREDELKQQKKRVGICLSLMSDWIVNHLNFETLGNDCRSIELDLPEQRTKIEDACVSLRDQLVKARK